MPRRILALAVVLAALLAPAALAGCGSSKSSSSSSTSTTQMSTATVRTASGSLGTFLVAADGRTVYLFARDRGPHSTCSGACIAGWPAVTTHGKPQASGSANAAMLGVTKRSDGTTQVTYAGHPLYFYAGDGAASDTNGQGVNAFGAKWYVVAPGGTAVTKQASSGSGGGGGSGY